MSAYSMTFNIYADDLVWYIFVSIFFYVVGYTTAVVMRG